VRVTHPFHPWHGREFELVTCRRNWGEDRVYFHDGDGRLVSLPAGWTDAVGPDPFVVVSAGRSAFRTQDLIELAGLVRNLSSGSGPERCTTAARQANYAASVNENMPHPTASWAEE
jgi:hypothetical protein